MRREPNLALQAHGDQRLNIGKIYTKSVVKTAGMHYIDLRVLKSSKSPTDSACGLGFLTIVKTKWRGLVILSGNGD